MSPVMGVSFILTVHITLLGIISVGCRRSFLPFNNMTPQITKDEKMIKCGILHLLADGEHLVAGS